MDLYVILDNKTPGGAPKGRKLPPGVFWPSSNLEPPGATTLKLPPPGLNYFQNCPWWHSLNSKILKYLLISKEIDSNYTHNDNYTLLLDICY